MRENLEKTTQAPSRKFIQLVDAAEILLQRHGLQRVSVEEICRQAGVSKMTFYKYFTNKVDLAKYLISGMMDRMEKRYREIMDGDATFAEKMKKLIVMKMEKAEEFNLESMGELYRNPSTEIAVMLEKRGKSNMEMVLDDFAEAKARGEMNPKINPEFIIFFLNQMTLWMSDEAFLGMYDSLPELTRELIHFFFYGILGEIDGEGEEK